MGFESEGKSTSFQTFQSVSDFILLSQALVQPS